MTLPDDATIRQLDGPALTRLALALALAPEGFLTCGHERLSQTTLPGISRRAWRPHTNVTQARTLFFDRLRQIGFIVSHYAGPPEPHPACPGIGFGRVFAKPFIGVFPKTLCCGFEILWGIGEPGNPAEPSEALALLRCACLARAAQRREEA